MHNIYYSSNWQEPGYQERNLTQRPLMVDAISRVMAAAPLMAYQSHGRPLNLAARRRQGLDAYYRTWSQRLREEGTRNAEPGTAQAVDILSNADGTVSVQKYRNLK